MADLNTNNSALQSILTAVNNLLTIDDITPELIGADDRGSAAAALTSAKSYTDSEIAELINGAPTTLDTLGEIATAMSENADVVEALNTAIGNKVDKVSGKGLSTNDYTTTEKNKLSGIASGAEVNQNAFSNITVDSTTIAADSKTDTLTLVAGSNVTLTADATNDKVTIAAKDTIYTHPTYSAKSSGLYKVTVDSTGHVSGTSAIAKSDITALGIPAQDTTYSAATTSAAGLMSASDKTKLDGIATGANAYSLPTASSSTLGGVKIGTGIGISSGVISNSGVHSIATGSTNGTISVNTNGSSAEIAVKGLGSNAYSSTSYLPLAGGTVTGVTTFSNTTAASSTTTGAVKISGGLGVAGNIYGTKVYGAVWNDYAEYRNQDEEIDAGYIVYCDDDGKLKLTTERLQKFEGVISDTFGFAIGKTEECKTPLAVSGRVLVYCDPEDRFHSGDCVCAGLNGIAYRMTREEIIEYPDRIVGVVSEIPTYEYWGSENIKVNGRIWIKVK